MSKTLTDYKVLTFDCYGTVIDWESGIWDAYQPLLMANGCTDITRQTALRGHAEAEHTFQAEAPGLVYPELLSGTHARFADAFGLQTTAELDQAFGATLPHWPAFPDTADALRVLKAHYKLVILSNVNRDGFAGANRKLGVEFDAIYTAEDVGSYKPNPANFEYMLEHLKSDLGLEKADILHTAQSLFHDHVPARAFGIDNAWIDRQGLNDGGDWGATAEVAEKPTFDFIFPTMEAMADAVTAAAS